MCITGVTCNEFMPSSCSLRPGSQTAALSDPPQFSSQSRIAAEDMVLHALGEGSAEATLQQDQAAINQGLGQLVGALTGDAASPGARFRSNAFVAGTTARFIGACAEWFAGGAPLARGMANNLC